MSRSSQIPSLLGGVASVAVLVAILAPATGLAQSLRGSKASIQKQRSVAERHDFSVLRSPSQVNRFVDLGLLVRVPGNRDYLVDNEVSFPYARPEVKTFIERLSRQYRAASGERLVVTSLTRPTSRQPRNASEYSVHPCGMAVDIRRPTSRKGRAWLEKVLIHLERSGVVEATRERRPPHYHVAVFPDPYRRYVEAIGGTEKLVAYKVRPGDSLWEIARHHGTTIGEIRAANRIESSRIVAGQTLMIPQAR